MHVSSEPAILYFGTPVVLISTTNEDGTPNLAPGQLHASALGQIPEAMYRSPDVDRGRTAGCLRKALSNQPYFPGTLAVNSPIDSHITSISSHIEADT